MVHAVKKWINLNVNVLEDTWATNVKVSNKNSAHGIAFLFHLGPCQDILLGCEYYDENDFCNSLNQNVSIHYQTNCAITCGKCTADFSKSIMPDNMK